VTLLAIPAFVSSAASTLSIQDDILTDCIKPDSESFQAYLSAWSGKFGAVPDILPTKQPFWDRPGVLEDKAQVEASLTSTHLRALFPTASTQHSGDWLFAMPIASCGLRLDDEAVRVAVGLRLGLDLVFSERELTFTFAICYRPSVCRLSVCLSSVCLSSVTFVRPTQAVEIFRNISTALGTLAIH